MPKAPSAPRQHAKDREKGPKTVTQGFSTGSKSPQGRIHAAYF